jgi:peptidoglycan/LPS O-acetylase OafA/YrhL
MINNTRRKGKQDKKMNNDLSGHTAPLLLLFIVVWLLAPFIAASSGRPDEAAWVPLYCLPSGLLGTLLCLVRFWVNKKWLSIFIHMVIAFGLHPR